MSALDDACHAVRDWQPLWRELPVWDAAISITNELSVGGAI